jgi:hypothetical protein
MKCSEFITGITELAFGGESPQAAQHVSVCPTCKSALDELSKIAAILAVRAYTAPENVISRAKAIRFENRSRLRLTGSTLALQGVRQTNADSFQRLFEAGGVVVRIMYSRTDGGWIVTGRATPPPEAANVGGKRLELREGAFELEVKDIADSSIEISYPSATFVIPPGSEDVENVDG